MKKLSLLLVLMLVLLAPLEVSAARVVNYNGIDTSGNATYYAGKYGEAFLGVPPWYGGVYDSAYSVLISKNLHYNCKGGNMVQCWEYERDSTIAELYSANFSGPLSASFPSGLLPPPINSVNTPLPIYDKVLRNSGMDAFYMSGKTQASHSSSTEYSYIYRMMSDGKGATLSTYSYLGTPHIALMVYFKGDDVLFLKEM